MIHVATTTTNKEISEKSSEKEKHKTPRFQK